MGNGLRTKSNAPRLLVALGLTLCAFVLVACGSSGDDELGGQTSPEDNTPAVEASPDEGQDLGSDETEVGGTQEESSDPDPAPETVPATFEVQPSVRQVTIDAADPGVELTLVSNGAANPVTGTVDELGHLIFRNVEPDDGPYTVTAADGSTSEAFDVLDPGDHPPASFFEAQTLEPGLNYIETRDGTLLAAMVRLPGPVEDGPYPTVVEYSGYTPADPNSPQPSTSVASTLGFATVGVNMRGSGCSGGAFDYFEELQSTDGYDMIEAIASQPWVMDNEVGMVGISYPGISQLFVAATNPPGLAAITPVAVIDDTYRSVLYPGGIYNSGFAKEWGAERQDQTRAYGQDWVTTQVEEAGDSVCADNQLMRSQNVDLAAQARASGFYDPEIGDRLSPATFVDRIDVPVFLAGSWQDEQTGPRFATMLGNFSSAPLLRVHLQNGAHADSYGPYVIQRWSEFLDLYVAKKTPEVSPLVRLGAPGLFADAFGVEGVELPADRFTDLGYEEALAAYEAENPVHLLIGNGAQPDAIGVPVPQEVLEFSAWPPPEAELTEWYFGEDGALLAEAPDSSGADDYVADAAEGELVTPSAEDTPEFTDLVWEPLGDGAAVSYETEPFDEATLLAGSGRADLWASTDAGEMDIEVTITEIRADGQEQLVQNGWLRASHRALDDEASSDAQPVQSHLAEDLQPVEPGEMVAMEIEIFPVAHVFHPGSRLRLVVDTPGGNRNRWKFELDPEVDGSTISVARGGDTPSRLVLPLVPTATGLPADPPPCVGLRSQPCREYVATDNR